MPIHAAASKGKIRAVKTLIQLGEDLNALGTHDFTPLIVAVIFQNHDVAKYLVQMGADVHIQSSFNQTALDIALIFNDEEMEMILKHGSV